MTFVAEIPSSSEDASPEAAHDTSSSDAPDENSFEDSQEPEPEDPNISIRSPDAPRDRSRSPRPRDHDAEGSLDRCAKTFTCASSPMQFLPKLQRCLEIAGISMCSPGICNRKSLIPAQTLFCAEPRLLSEFLGCDAIAELASSLQPKSPPGQFIDCPTSEGPAWRPPTRSCKLLPEPQKLAGFVDQDIATLRRVTRRLGYSWRYFSPEPEPQPRDSEEEDSDSTIATGEPTLMHFLILSLGHSAVHVAFYQTLPITVDEALQQIQSERCPSQRLRYPSLVPAHPQPCPGSGVVLAIPEWCTDAPAGRCFLCLDTSAIDSRLFVVTSPQYLSRRHLLHLADLPPHSGVAVYAQDDPTPLDDEAQCHVYDGATFIFLLPGAVVPTLHSLAVELLSRQAWSPALTAPVAPLGHQFCLVHESDTILFTMQQGTPMSYRSQISACLGFRRERLRLFPANPRVSDASLQGHACRSVIAVCESPIPTTAAFHAVLLDARALLSGWHTYDTSQSRFSCAAALADLQQALPTGWQVTLADFPPGADLVDTVPGQVVVALVSRSPRAVPPQGPLQHPGGDTPDPNSASAANPPQQPSTPAPSGRSASDTSSTTDPYPGQTGPQAALYHSCVFFVLGQNYTPEMIEVRLTSGTNLQEALRLVAAGRSPRDATLLPGLVPVHPQPNHHGLILAAPAWPCAGAIVAFDLRPIGGSVFALHLFGRLSRQDLIRAAQVDDGFQGEIFVGSLPWPLLANTSILLVTGDLVIFRPGDDEYHCVASLSDMLQSPDDWDGDYDPTADFGHSSGQHTWIIGEDRSFLFPVHPDRHRHFRQDVARLLGLPLQHIGMQLAHQSIRDFAHRGALVNGIFAAVEAAQGSTAMREHDEICFLDARPVLLNFSSLRCRHSLLDTVDIANRYVPRCPPSYEVCLLRSDFQRIPTGERVRVAAGEVIIITYQLLSGSASPPETSQTDDPDRAIDDDGPPPDAPADPNLPSNVSHLAHARGYQDDTGGTYLDGGRAQTPGDHIPPRQASIAHLPRAGLHNSSQWRAQKPSGCAPSEHANWCGDNALSNVMWLTGYQDHDVRAAGRPSITPDAPGDAFWA